MFDIKKISILHEKSLEKYLNSFNGLQDYAMQESSQNKLFSIIYFNE